ncbi:MAG: hypothetical protein AAF340_11600 [Pseudomonadota bacterium]
MRKLICGLALSLGCIASGAQAEITLNVDGTEYPLSTLMENCKSMSAQPEAQIACFNALSKLLAGQGDQAQTDPDLVPNALDSLRAAAEHQTEETGLSIFGSDCKIQIVYFNNYYHLSRRNVSTIDLYSAHFDASKLNYEQSAAGADRQSTVLNGRMRDGARAVTRGGTELDSATHRFEPKSARVTMAAYANEVAAQLPGKEDQAFGFVLVHPDLKEASDEIWSAFETFVSACQKGMAPIS